jgi:hypothetical protein
MIRDKSVPSKSPPRGTTAHYAQSFPHLPAAATTPPDPKTHRDDVTERGLSIVSSHVKDGKHPVSRHSRLREHSSRGVGIRKGCGKATESSLHQLNTPNKSS